MKLKLWYLAWEGVFLTWGIADRPVFCVISTLGVVHVDMTSCNHLLMYWFLQNTVHTGLSLLGSLTLLLRQTWLRQLISAEEFCCSGRGSVAFPIYELGPLKWVWWIMLNGKRPLAEGEVLA
jgi:hypothetical protein